MTETASARDEGLLAAPRRGFFKQAPERFRERDAFALGAPLNVRNPSKRSAANMQCLHRELGQSGARRSVCVDVDACLDTISALFGEERATWRERCTSREGSAEIWLVSPRCAVLTIAGYVDVALANKVVRLIALGLAVAPDVKLVAFCDYLGVTAADPPARMIITGWVKSRKEKFEMFHYAVPSKIIALTVQVAGLWHGIPSKTWTSRARMELEFHRIGTAS